VFQRVVSKDEDDEKQNEQDRFIFERVQLDDDDYDRVFCGVYVTRDYYWDLHSLIKKPTGRVVICLQEGMRTINQNSNTFRRRQVHINAFETKSV
jgi:hypothetical protein